MNSSISASKIFLPLLVAALCVLCIELACALFLPGDLSLLQSPLLHMAYAKAVRVERINSAVKLTDTILLPGNILQVGDSSGLVSLNPRIINPLLPPPYKLLNLGMQVPAQFIGHEADAEVALQTHPGAKYILLAVSPLHIGRPDEGFGDDIRRAYVSFPLWRLFPSLKARAFITNLVYYGVADPRAIFMTVYRTSPPEHDEVSGNVYNVRTILASQEGWNPLQSHQPYIPHACSLIQYDSRLVAQRLEAIYSIAARHRAGTILVLGSLSCTADATTAQLERDIRQFQATHPDFLTPLPLIQSLPPALQGDDVHATPEGSTYISRQLGKALSRMLPPVATPPSAGAPHP